jgi:hypothetical protein
MTDPQSTAAGYANAAVVALGLIFGACAAREHVAEASPAGLVRLTVLPGDAFDAGAIAP